MSSSFFRRPGEGSSSSSSSSSSGSESDHLEVVRTSSNQPQDISQELGEAATTESFSGYGSDSLGDGPDLPINSLDNVDQHRTNLLSALLEDFARNQACEMLNKATPDATFNKSSTEVQPLASKLYEQLIHSFVQTGLLPNSTVNNSHSERHTRETYLAGVERIALGSLQNNELLRADAHSPTPAGDQQLAVTRIDSRPVGSTSDNLRQSLANLSVRQNKEASPWPYSDLALSASTAAARRSHYESSFQQLNLLGKGGFGRVYHAWNLFDKKEYAVKKIPLSARLSQRYRESGHQELENVLREVQALAQLEHQNVVRYHATWIEEPKEAPTARREHKKPDIIIHGRKLIESKPVDSRLQNSTHPQHLFITEVSDDGIVFGADSASSAPIHMLESDAGQGSSMRLSDLDSVSARPSEIFTDGLAEPNLQEEDIDQSVHVLHVQMSLYPMTLAQYLAPVPGQSRSAPKNPSRRHCFHLVPALRILLGILCGLQYIHAKGLVHRDLKPSNVFLSSFDMATGLVSEGFYDVGSCVACPHPSPHFVNPRIGDLGLVAELTQDDDELGTDTTASPRTRVVGTEYYRPPPWTDSKGKRRAHPSINEKLDVFALGVVLVEMLWCCNTSSERSIVLRDLQKGNLPDSLREKIDQEGHEPGIGRLVLQCIQGMVEQDPRRRWGCAEVKDWVEMMLQKCKSSRGDGEGKTAGVGTDLSQIRSLSLDEEVSAGAIPETDTATEVEY